MRDHHLHENLIAEVLAGKTEGRDLVKGLLDHLIAICPECRAAWRRISLPVGRSSKVADAEPLKQEKYGEAIYRATASIRNASVELQVNRDTALNLVTDLVQRTEPERLRLLEMDQRYSTWSVCDLLIQESQQATLEDPASGEALASLAVSLANRLDPRTVSTRLLGDTRALAWTCLGNARRVNSDLKAADEALALAESLLEEGTGDPLARAHVLDVKASLRRDQRRFDECQELIDNVLEIYQEVEDPHLEGRTLVQKGVGLWEVGDPLQAIPHLRAALNKIDAERDPRLLLCAQHGLALCCIDAGMLAEAEELAALSRPLYQRCADFAVRVRLRWLEGRLARARDRFEAAEAAFLDVRREFLARSIGYDAALVSLDLAALYASRGMTAEVKALAEEMLPIFEARDIHREAAAALIIFQQAARTESVTLALTRQLTEYLRRSRRDPSLRCDIQVA